MRIRKAGVRLSLALAAGLALVAAGAPPKKHPQVDLDQACQDCHSAEQEAWAKGRHAEMGVQCVVCHGSLDATFFRTPPVARCNGCHADKVAELKGKVRPGCAGCHDRHTLAAKSKTPFHRKGAK